MFNIFNTHQFFEKAAHYASAGRGLFTISTVPEIFATSTDVRIIQGMKLLKEGIVAKSFSIPGQQLATHDGVSFSGPTKKIPYLQVFGDLGVDFLLMNDSRDNAGSLYYTLIKWQELIAGPIDTRSVSKDTRSNSTAFGVRYYDDYVVDAVAKIYSPTSAPEKPAIELLYTELYPISIGGLTTSWESPDSPLILSVNFSYHYSKIRN